MRTATSLCITALLCMIASSTHGSAVALGTHRSLIIRDDGYVYIFGYWALREYWNTPKKVPMTTENMEIIAVAIGDVSSVMLDNNGTVFAFEYGSGEMQSIKGLPPVQKVFMASTSFVFLDHNGQVWTLAEKNLIVEKLEGLPEITDIATGTCHFVFLDAFGDVWTFGDGSQGKLGHQNVEDLKHPKKIENVQGMPKINAIAAGESHTILLDENGDVWSFGYGWGGQNGHGRGIQNRPRKILMLPKIATIASGRHHSVLIDKESNVWTFGIGESGQLGHGDGLNQRRPKKIESIQMPRIISAACGDSHTILTDEAGALWSFGDGAYGKLGYDNPTAQTVPRKIENFFVNVK